MKRSPLEDPRAFLTELECRRLAERASSFFPGEGGKTGFQVVSWWAGELRWARNRVSLASDRRDRSITLTRNLPTGELATVTTNQIDDDALRATANAARVLAERTRTQHGYDFLVGSSEEPPPIIEYEGFKPEIFSERTYNLSGEARGEIARAMVEPAETAGMLAAGYLDVRGSSRFDNREGPAQYSAGTSAQCSMTVRDPKGIGSGWAGVSSWDWGRIDTKALAQRALEKCLASRNPVALEPGRYTVILEPQAVHDIVRLVSSWLPDRFAAEHQRGPFAGGTDSTGLGISKLGLKVMDERITIGADPTDPDLAGAGLGFDSLQRVTWIEHGVLKALGYRRSYSVGALNENDPLLGSGYRITPGEATLDEMIATTRRGLLVTRFSNVRVLDPTSLLSTGLTRDGLWLIEHGKITKAVKNFRFTESPMFMLNSIEQVGTPAVPVFSPGAPAVVPPLKARDFSFTSLIDAI